VVLGTVVTRGVHPVIFDFDGTLFDLPVDWPGVRAELGLADGASITEWMQRSIDSGDTAGFEVVRRYELAAVPRGRFLNGAEHMLATLRRPAAVLTRNSAACVRAALGGLADGMFVVGREDVRRLKPDPEGVHAVLAHFGADPDGCVLVGDTFHDVQAARAAGIRSVVVPNPALAYRPAGADLYVDSFAGPPFD
jgi:HAD superfamily hydrolase (TIGR01509 family)